MYIEHISRATTITVHKDYALPDLAHFELQDFWRDDAKSNGYITVG
jgi:hypothetical protein